MRISPTRRVATRIPTASMADIAFLLIIFFMITTVHEVDRTAVQLPLSRHREEAERGAAYVILVKRSTGELAYRFSDGVDTSTPISGPNEIYLEASRLTYEDPARQFVLKIDGDVHFEKVDELLDQLRRGGVQNVLLLTAQKTDAP